MIQDRIGLIRALRAYGWEKVGWFVPLAVTLEGCTAAEAAWQPPGGGNTIWQTVNHINHYNEHLICRMMDRPFETFGTNEETFGAPGNPEDAASWQATLGQTHRIAEELNGLFGAASDAELDVMIGDASRVDRLASWIMHDTYHTGQIALLRKMQGWKGHTWH